MPKAPPRIALAPDLEISRVVIGLWQVADMERGGRTLDPEAASSAMLDYARAGFDSFDMADHYGTRRAHRRALSLPRRGRRGCGRRRALPPSPNGARRRGR